MNVIIKFLRGRPGEEKKMILLLTMGFFMGIFLATMQVPAETLVTLLGPEVLVKAFLMSGAMGVLSASIYVYAQRHVRFSRLVMMNIFVICVYMFGIRISFDFLDHARSSFVLFVMMGPLTAIMLLSFWGIFGRMFDIRASKRVIGGVDTGQLLATCVAFFAISFVSDYIETVNILWFSALGALGVLFTALKIVFTYNLDSVKFQGSSKVAGTSKEQGKRVTYRDLFKNKYFAMLSIFLICSVCVSKFNEFSYRTSMYIYYEGDEAALNKVYSIIDAIIILVSFIVQSFVNDFVIERFGLKISLMLMPVVLGVFTLGAIFSGHFFGYAERTADYFVFFSFNVMGRIVTTSLRDALENPAFKMFFFPLDARKRFDVQSRIEGVVNEFAALAAGALLIGLGALPFFGLIHFSYLLVLIVIATLYVAGRLFWEYKGALKESLTRQKTKLQSKGTRNEKNLAVLLSNEVHSSSPKHVIFALKLMEGLEPMRLRLALVEVLHNPSAKVRTYAYKKCMEFNTFEHLEAIEKVSLDEKDETVRPLAMETVAHLQKSMRHSPNFTTLYKQIRSEKVADRLYAAQILARMQDDVYKPLLVELLRDLNPAVKKAAMMSVGLQHAPEYWTALIENLHLSAYSNVASAALVASGQRVFQSVDTAFYRTNQHFRTMLRIVQILGRIGGPEGMERIWKKVDYPNKQIFMECVLSMSYHSYRTNALRAARLKLQMEEDIGDIAWNINAMRHIPTQHTIDKLLRHTLREENQQNRDDIFLVMMMVYDPQSVLLVKNNVSIGSADSITYAIGLMDIFLDEDIKLKLFPLFEDLTHNERLSKLNNFFAPEDFSSYEDVLLQIINRDNNRMGRWGKALALYRLSMLKSARITADIVAQIFNKDPLLLQTTAYVLYAKDKQEYRKNTFRLVPEVRKRLDLDILPQETDGGTQKKPVRKLLQIEKTIFLKNLRAFQYVSGDILVSVAARAKELRLPAKNHFIKKGDSGKLPIYIIIEGKVGVYEGQKEMTRLSKGDIIGFEMLVSSEHFMLDFLTLSEATLLTISMDDFFDMLSMHEPLLEAVLSYSHTRNGQAQREVEQEDIWAYAS